MKPDLKKKTSETVRTLMRWVYTIVLLCIVWRHAHWSVALALTLITLDIETANHLMSRVIDLIGVVVERMKDDAIVELVEKLDHKITILH